MWAVLLLILALFTLGYGSGETSLSSPSATAVAPERERAGPMPYVVGVNAATAAREVRGAGLLPALRWCATTWPGEYVVRTQLPAPGTVLPLGARVTLLLVPGMNSGVRHPSCTRFVATRPPSG
jgi:hypothetical protein